MNKREREARAGEVQTQIIDVLAEDAGWPRTTSEIAQLVNLERVTAWPHLVALECQGLVERITVGGMSEDLWKTPTPPARPTP